MTAATWISSATLRSLPPSASSLAERLLKEEMRRRHIRANLGDWAFHNGFHAAKHHRLLIKELEGVVAGTCDRLAFFLPPGSAKSTYASVLFPSWLVAQWANKSVLAASHTTELAWRFGRRCRNLVHANEHILKTEIANDSGAAGRWETSNGFSYYAAGVDTGIAGFRADLAIIDDPIRSRADAHSETKRDRAWEWYKSDLIPRMRPRGAIILVQTRWHEDDLAGRILAESAKTGERWRVINVPAQAEKNDQLGRPIGEFLWGDDDYGYDTVMRREKATQLPSVWSALYQQRPTPEEGDYFKREWIKTYDVLPPLHEMRIYGASDFAVTADGGDYTVHIIIGLDTAGRMYVLDIWRAQASSDRWVESFCDLVKRWKPIGWAVEAGQIRSSVGPFLLRRMRERKAFVALQDFPTKGDKAIRAQSIRARMAIEGLYCSPHAPWFEAFLAELLSCWSGKHDDQADALGLIGMLLETMVYGQKSAKDKTPKPFKDYAPLPSNQDGLHSLDKAM
jgi:predicted phage terminase large subunit-like protein